MGNAVKKKVRPAATESGLGNLINRFIIQECRGKSNGRICTIRKRTLPVFAEIERIKEKHRITSLTLESFNLIDQFHGSHGGKGSFMGKREYKHTRSIEQNFTKVK